MSSNNNFKFIIVFAVLFSFLPASVASAVSNYRGYSKLPEPPVTSKGELLYKESDCSMCHGELGDGEGFLAEGLTPKPRDFTDFLQMANIPDLQMDHAILKGVEGTGMPAHPDFNEEQIQELILYLRSLLAETYLTINLCFTASHVIDTGAKGLDLADFRVEIGKPDLINVKQEGNLILISVSKSMSTLKTMFAKRVTRTYVKLIEKDSTLSLIAVRVLRCVR